ncbi:MAG: uroporphyrinogen-III C-methyltransferase [Nitrospirae bacterium]|nr:uroporphyrinogen-III C-methyltransferase [Nitrospirota bacterium]
MEQSSNPGTVYLVGAGPGDPELLTLKGARVLGLAEVVVYDALIQEGLLGMIPKDAELVFMGKRCGRSCPSQDEINDALIAHARTGRTVVRLKGGDPFVFGRGGEEVLALGAAGIPCEVIPGVTAGVAVPASMGIPVTHRGKSGSVAFVTGHPGSGLDDPVNWESLATAVSTIIIYMGLTRLPEIAERLIAAGRASDTPAAVVSQGTGKDQRQVVSTLDNLFADACAAGIETPALIIIGPVVGLRKQFATLTAAALPAEP